MAIKGRIAAFGFRSVPSKPGCAGADKFAEELYARLAQRGYEVTGYNRVYESNCSSTSSYQGVDAHQLADAAAQRHRGPLAFLQGHGSHHLA